MDNISLGQLGHSMTWFTREATELSANSEPMVKLKTYMVHECVSILREFVLNNKVLKTSNILKFEDTLDFEDILNFKRILEE